VATLEFNETRMKDAVTAGFSQATDLADHLMTMCGLDYRTAYRVVGTAVHRAAAAGLRGVDLGVDDLAAVAEDLTGTPIVLDAAEMAAVLDPAAIVATRMATGGAAPGPTHTMIDEVRSEVGRLAALSHSRSEAFAAADAALRARAADIAGGS